MNGYQIDDIKRITLGPDDVLWIRLTNNPTAADMDRFSAAIAGTFPVDRVLITDDNVEMQVVDTSTQEPRLGGAREWWRRVILGVDEVTA